MTNPPDQFGQQGSSYPSGYPQGGYGAAQPYGAQPYGTPVPLRRKRGQRTIQVGAILMAIGVILAVIGGVIGEKNAYGKVDSFQRVAVKDGTGTVTFKNAGGYVAYYESDSVTNSTNQRVPEIPVRLTNQATGQQMILQTPYGNRSDNKIKFLHYDHNGHKGLAMWQFHIDQAGTYKVEVGNNAAAAPDATIAFGKSIARGVVVGGVLVIIGVLLLVAGLITLIVGFVLGRRDKRGIGDSGAAGFGSYGGYGGPQPAGWPPAGEQAPGWQSGQTGWPQGGQPGGQQSWPQGGQQGGQPGGQQSWPQGGQPGGQPGGQQSWPQGGQPGGQQSWPQGGQPGGQQGRPEGWPPSGQQPNP